MSLSSHIQELKKKHAKLSEQVELLEQDSAFDSMAVAKLKKQKLRLKDEIKRLTAPVPAESAHEHQIAAE